MDQCAPAVVQALTDALDALGVAWEYPLEQTCCGQFAYNAGEWQAARQLMRHFLQVFGAAETILCPSASCVLTVRQHYQQLAKGLPESGRLAQVQSRLWEWSEWLIQQRPLPWPMAFSGTLALHQSCAARHLGVAAHLSPLLSQVSRLNLKQVSPYYSCCGFGGTFSVNCPELSIAMGETYLRAVLDMGVDGLVSQDLSCLIHLEGIIRARNWPLRLYHLAELLAPGTGFNQK